MVNRPYSSGLIFLDNYNTFLLSVLVVIFPILFKLVFDEMPLEYIRNKNINRIKTNTIPGASPVTNSTLKQETVANINISPPLSIENNYKIKHIEESRLIAETIFSRAGAYLFVGCLIAFLGVALFYSPWFTNITGLETKDSTNTVELVKKNDSKKEVSKTPLNKNINSDTSQVSAKKLTPNTANLDDKKSDEKKEFSLWESSFGTKILSYIPRFGALFFVEFIAFFFLKQYRIMLEEYRYYEAVKRRRQDALGALDIIEKYQDKPEVLKLALTVITDESYLPRLTKDDTTQLIETHKLLNQETDFIGKLGDLIKTLKS